MILILSFLMLIAANLANATNTTSATPLPELKLTPAFTRAKFSQPVALYQSNRGQWFVVEQQGRIKHLSDAQADPELFLDITNIVESGGEKGLLGMALHPRFSENGLFYVSYTGENGDSIVSEYTSKNSKALADSQRIILRVEQPYSNHNGGQISFGPDDYLYIGLGDGGWGGDPKNNGQNLNTLLGAILRIDVNSEQGYKIPEDNPFFHSTSKKEIYAYGLRNPWRWSFDKKTGDLWLADVGQEDWEEINIIRAGGNYGWNIMEGNHCYSSQCKKEGLIAPVYEYSHELGQAITGGYVYRGKEIPELSGVYVYGDYVSGRVWGLKQNHEGSYTNFEIMDTSHFISSFAEDIQGNLYLISYREGKIYRFTKTP